MIKGISLSIIPLLMLAQLVYAGGTAVTPYGDYSVEITVYGFCRVALPREDVQKVLEKYYHDKGLRVGAIHGRGRFVVADIYQGDKLVDRVLFDRKTGRLRSIY